MRYKTLKLLGLALVLFVITSCSLTGSGSGDEPAPTDESTSSVGGSGSEEEPAPTDEATSGSEDESVITSEGMPVTGTGLCANAYYPVREGATWSYQGTSTAADDYAFTNTITSTRNDGFTVSVEFDNVVALSQERLQAAATQGLLQQATSILLSTRRTHRASPTRARSCRVPHGLIHWITQEQWTLTANPPKRAGIPLTTTQPSKSRVSPSLPGHLTP